MITTGSKINLVLRQNAAVAALVSSRIYPLVLPENTVLPCIVYERSFANQHTKDLLASSDSTVNITIFAKDYVTTVQIAEAVDAALKGYRDSSVKRVNLANGAETYAEGAFIQNLSYQVVSV